MQERESADRAAPDPEAVGGGQAPPARLLRPDLASPEAIIALQRSAGNAAVGRMLARRRTLARSVLTIHSTKDRGAAMRATRNCRDNLTKVKTGGHPMSADAPRGESFTTMYDPDADTFTQEAPSRLASGSQTIYILGHGSALGGTISDLSPERLVEKLKEWFGAVDFRGKIKLVSCTTAATQDRDESVSPPPPIPSFTGQGALEGVSIVDRVADLMRTEFAHVSFQPRSVDGVLGICWVDEKTGKITSIDLDQYLSVIATANPFTIRGADKRYTEIQKHFGKHMSADKHAGARKRVPLF